MHLFGRRRARRILIFAIPLALFGWLLRLLGWLADALLGDVAVSTIKTQWSAFAPRGLESVVDWSAQNAVGVAVIAAAIAVTVTAFWVLADHLKDKYATRNLPPERPKLAPVLYGVDEAGKSRGLVLVNHGEPAYDISTPDVSVDDSVVWFAGDAKYLAPEDELFVEPYVSEPSGIQMEDGLLDFMRQRKIREIQAAVYYRDFDENWYVTSCALQRGPWFEGIAVGPFQQWRVSGPPAAQPKRVLPSQATAAPMPVTPPVQSRLYVRWTEITNGLSLVLENRTKHPMEAVRIFFVDALRWSDKQQDYLRVQPMQLLEMFDHPSLYPEIPKTVSFLTGELGMNKLGVAGHDPEDGQKGRTVQPFSHPGKWKVDIRVEWLSCDTPHRHSLEFSWDGKQSVTPWMSIPDMMDEYRS